MIYFNDFSTKKLQTSKWPCIQSMYINNNDHKKIHKKIPPTTLVLKYVCNFSYFVVNIISSQIYLICRSSPMFVKYFF
jgi:hypothetical protein